MNNKLTGSFYTPEPLADFVVHRVKETFFKEGPIRILEPSVGDGVFVRSLRHEVEGLGLRPDVFHLTLVELEKKELEKAVEQGATFFQNIEAVSGDFLDFQKSVEEQFELIIGNPPYISTSRNLMPESSKQVCQGIYDSAKLASKKVRNIWTAFVIRCTQFLSEGGILALVLPSEILQTQAGQEVCTFLKKSFQRLEFHAFRELLFQGAPGQETVVFLGFKKHSEPGEYHSIHSLRDLNDTKPFLRQAQFSEFKNIHSGLFHEEELIFLKSLASNLQPIKTFTSSKPGLVTAANQFFIVNQTTLEKHQLQEFAKKMLQKSSFANGKIEFSSNDFEHLVLSQKPAFFLDFSDLTKNLSSFPIQEYLKSGLQSGLGERYKMKKRERWFVVPGSRDFASAFFFKRCHLHPKFILNTAQVLATDSAYLVNAKAGYNIKDIIFSFYNSLTLTFVELNGRFYGGGVLELTPKEFQNLPLPYLNVSQEVFDEFATLYHKSKSIEEVTDFTDFHVLQRHLKIPMERIRKAKQMKDELLNRRFRS